MLHRNRLENLQILVGTKDLKSGGSIYYVERARIHEEYTNNQWPEYTTTPQPARSATNNNDYTNDIALLRILGQIQLNVRPIEYSAEEVTAGANAQLTGWG